VGLAAAVGAGRIVSGLLFGVDAADPLIFAAVPLVLLAASAAAGWLPAGRAAAVDPIVSLRGS
jgi:ABC-type lipoprotein release transport system permease subunit